MELINVTASIDAPVEMVWSLFSDFGGVDRIFPIEGVPPLGCIEKVDMEGEGLGSIRTMYFSNSDPVQERLTRCDHDSLIMEYEALALPIGVEDYRARIMCQREAVGRTGVIYTAQGVPTFMTQSELREMLTPLFSALISRARELAEPRVKTA